MGSWGQTKTQKPHSGQNTYLMVGDGDGLPEDDPFHDFTTRGCGQRPCVSIIAAQGWRQEVSEDKGIQEGLFLWREKGKKKHNGELFHAAHTQLTQLTCWRHLTSLLFVHMQRSCSIWWCESLQHGNISQDASVPRTWAPCASSSHTGRTINRSRQHTLHPSNL